MKKSSWLPVEVIEPYKGYYIAVFRNNRGEEANLEIYRFGIFSGNSECWDECSGDWPGCKHSCPIYNIPFPKSRFDLESGGYY